MSFSGWALIAGIATITGAAGLSVPVPAGIADPTAQVLYLSTLDKSVVAIDLVRGAMLWRTASPLTPLAIFGGQLVAFLPGAAGRTAAIVLVSPDARLAVAASIPLALPDGINSSSSDFSVQATVVGAALDLRWKFEPQMLYGNARQAGAPFLGIAPSAGKIAIDLERIRITETTSLGFTAPAAADQSTSQSSVDGRYTVVPVRDNKSSAGVFVTSTGEKIGDVFRPDYAGSVAVVSPRVLWLVATPSGGRVVDSIAAVRLNAHAVDWRFELGSRPAIRPIR